MRQEDTNESTGRQAAEKWAYEHANAHEMAPGWMGIIGLMIEAFEAGRASVLGDTSEPLSEHPFDGQRYDSAGGYGVPFDMASAARAAQGLADAARKANAPLADHGLCSCGAMDPCEGGHDR